MGWEGAGLHRAEGVSQTDLGHQQFHRLIYSPLPTPTPSPNPLLPPHTLTPAMFPTFIVCVHLPEDLICSLLGHGLVLNARQLQQHLRACQLGYASSVPLSRHFKTTYLHFNCFVDFAPLNNDRIFNF